MTFRCNGCGGEYAYEWLGAVVSHGGLSTTVDVSTDADTGDVTRRKVAYSDYQRTLCVGCWRVAKSILLNSDLSEHWEDEDLPDEFEEEHVED